MQKEALRSTRFRGERVPCLLISQHTAAKTLKKEKFYSLRQQNNKINKKNRKQDLNFILEINRDI